MKHCSNLTPNQNFDGCRRRLQTAAKTPFTQRFIYMCLYSMLSVGQGTTTAGVIIEVQLLLWPLAGIVVGSSWSFDWPLPERVTTFLTREKWFEGQKAGMTDVNTENHAGILCASRQWIVQSYVVATYEIVTDPTYIRFKTYEIVLVSVLMTFIWQPWFGPQQQASWPSTSQNDMLQQ